MITYLYENVKGNIAYRLELAKDVNTSPDVLAQLAQDSKQNVQLAAALNPNTPMDSVMQIVNNNYYIAQKVAANKNTSPELLKKLYDIYKTHNRGYEVLSFLAKNPNTPVNTLRAIANRGFENELAGNPSVPQSILTKMYDDDFRVNSSIRSKIMRNPQMKTANRKQMLDKGHDKFFDEYVGKDLWIEAYSYGISRDYECYVRLISKTRKSSFKDVYTYNMVYDQYYNMDDLDREMNETEKGIINEYGSTTNDTDIYIYNNAKTLTTDQIIELLT